jgi:hypothetical protein
MKICRLLDLTTIVELKRITFGKFPFVPVPSVGPSVIPMFQPNQTLHVFIEAASSRNSRSTPAFCCESLASKRFSSSRFQSHHSFEPASRRDAAVLGSTVPGSGAGTLRVFA